MGLRIKIGLWLLSLFLLCGGLGLWLLQERVKQSYGELERDAALAEFGRLLRTLDEELVKLDRVLREWSQRDDLYELAASPAQELRAAKLTPQAIAASGLAWLAVHDERDQLRIDVLSEPSRRPDINVHLGPVLRPMLARGLLASRPGTPCGFVRIRDRLLMLCQRPLRRADGSGAQRGVVTVGEWLTEHEISHVVDQTSLQVRTPLIEQAAPLADEVDPTHFDSLTGYGRLRVEHGEHETLLRWPIRDLQGDPIAVLEAVWPHEVLARGEALLQQVRWLALALAAALVLGLALVVDRMVVARLGRLRAELATLRRFHRWSSSVSVGGNDEISDLARGTNHLLGVIASQVDALETLSQTDALTGLANRRHFNEKLSQALRASARSGEPLCLLLVDVDHFKAYNDHYGHQQGDLALRAVAKALAGVARRPSDLAARIGGEEFALVLEDTDLGGAAHCGDAVRAALQARDIAHAAGGSSGRLTVSMGLALAGPEETPETLYARADAALYRAKTAGRDRLAT